MCAVVPSLIATTFHVRSNQQVGQAVSRWQLLGKNGSGATFRPRHLRRPRDHDHRACSNRAGPRRRVWRPVEGYLAASSRTCSAASARPYQHARILVASGADGAARRPDNHHLCHRVWYAPLIERPCAPGDGRRDLDYVRRRELRGEKRLYACSARSCPTSRAIIVGSRGVWATRLTMAGLAFIGFGRSQATRLGPPIFDNAPAAQ